MQEPFDIAVGSIEYAVFPEGNDVYTIFKDGKEYMQIQKDAETQWLKLDMDTALPLFEPDAELDLIGEQILAHVPEEEDDLEEYGEGDDPEENL
jgi:hypothetical protein